MTDTIENGSEILHYFVDEAGDPTIFDGKGRVLVGTEGCSKYFILGKLDIVDPLSLALELEALRTKLLAEPYFKRVPSMQPEKRKTADAFHAKDDIPEVRREVFNLLLRMDLCFYAVVRDKKEVLSYIGQQRERDEAYRYKEDDLYDALVSELFRKFRFSADVMKICFSKRGKRSRTEALRTALQVANREFEKSYGFSNSAIVEIEANIPPKIVGLQAVDYYLWALQRFYERGEDRFLELIWPHVREVHDLDLVAEGKRGVLFSQRNPLTLDVRFPKK